MTYNNNKKIDTCVNTLFQRSLRQRYITIQEKLTYLNKIFENRSCPIYMKGFFSREILELRIVALLFFSLGYYSCIKVYGHLYPYSIIWSI